MQLRFAFVYFALFSVFGVFTPYLQKLLALQGFDEEKVGFLLAAVETAGILAPPLWGLISDRSPYRRTLLAACVTGALLSVLLLASVRSFLPAFVFACSLGFFFRPIIPLTDGFVMRHIDHHGGDYGRMRTAGSLSFILTILTMELLGVAGSSAKKIILGAFVATSLLHLCSLRLLPTSSRSSMSSRLANFDLSLFRSRAFALFIAIAFLARMSMTGHYSFFTLFLQRELGFPQAGYLWIVGPISEIPVIFFSGSLISAFGVKAVLAMGVGASAVRLFGYCLAPSIYWILALQLLHSFTFGAFYTASIHYMQRLVPHYMKQSAMAIFNSLSFGLSAIVGSALGGVLIKAAGYRLMFGLYGAIAALALLVLLVFLRNNSYK